MTPPFIYRDGVHIAGTHLWCDAWHTRSVCFLSHAGRAPAARPGSGQLLCTAATHRLLPRAPSPGEALITPLGRPFSLGGLRLELFASGYLPGAASLQVTLPPGSLSPVVYTGDLNPTPHPRFGGPALQVRDAVALACHAPLAALPQPLPTWDEAEEALLRHIAAPLSEKGGLAVLLCPGPLCHVLLAVLMSRGLSPLCHPRSLLKWQALRGLGLPLPPGDPLRLSPARARQGGVLVWPLSQPLSPLLSHSPHLFLCTGAALSPEATARFAAALPKEASSLPLVAVPVPDSADRPGLLRYAADSGARVLYLTAGPPLGPGPLPPGLRVEPLGPPRQLALLESWAPWAGSALNWHKEKS